MRLGEVLRDVMIMLVPMFVVLMLVIVWPSVSLFLPSLISPEFLQ
jgi:TRAP-type C4-dicarboxylate transport system permease large subunit